jgi:hypothetical protein
VTSRTLLSAFGALASLATASLARAGEGDVPPAPPPPDVRFYGVRVAPFLEARCSSCHRSGSTRWSLSAPLPGEPAERRRRRDFEALGPVVDRGAPARSLLLRKILPERDGGLPHAGGAFLTPDDEEHDDLLDFVCGATLENLPPIAVPGKDRRVRIGSEEVLDAVDSYDRDDDPLGFRWDLASRPPGSRASLEDARTPRARLTPDVGGAYVVHLRVTDGKAWSPPHAVVLEAADVLTTGTDPLEPSGLEAIAPEALRRVRLLHFQALGRGPTPAEARARASKPVDETATLLLASLEAGRAFVEDERLRLGLGPAHEPATEEATSLPLRLAAGEVSPAAAEAALVRDPAFLRAHPAGAPFVRAVFSRLLEREPAEGEAKAMALAMAGVPSTVLRRERVASAVGVLEAVLASSEFEVAALRRHVARWLSPADAASVPAPRAREPASALAVSFVRSPQWGRPGTPRRKSGPAFLRGAFAELAGRRPTFAELSALVRAAQVVPGDASRNALVKVLLDGGEARIPLLVDVRDPNAWIVDRFLRHLGRRPTEPEATAYAKALKDPDGGPEVVTRALLTCPEAHLL